MTIQFKTMKKILALSITILTLHACGPSPEEIQKREKAKQDSIQLAELKQKEIEEQQRIHEEKIEVGKSIKRTKLNNYLKMAEAKIKEENQKLSKINEFQIGRSSSTKSKQLSEQRQVIRELEKFKEALEYEISHTHLHQSYEFQETPEGTVQYLFDAAKSEDHSKLRDLLDPYGQFDDEAFSICLVEMYPSDMKAQWKNEFANGRIMGTPKINNEFAEIEIAMGISSNRLETLRLVNRQGRWYILGF